MASLAEIRAKLAQQETRSNNSGGGRDNAIFPHWNIPEGSTTRIRFLPDGDEKNDFFWVERAMIRLPFSGIKGQINSKPVTINVPCMEMWNETCPILTEVRTWFKDKSLEDMGKKYWKKRSYIFQGFVRETGLKEEAVPENPIRRFVVSPSIYPLIIAALKDPDIDELPTDFDRGLDFNITKTSKGQYADYATSNWARRESALTQTERAALEAYGLYNLGEFLPKKPSDTEVKIIKEMFEASVDGATYDADRWGSYYRPAGIGGNADADVDDTPVAKPTASVPKPQPKVEETAPWTEDEDTATASSPVSTPTSTSGGNKRAEEILQMIRARKTS